MNKKYSVVVPTMWKSNFIRSISSEYSKSNFITEIIIIDNNKEKRPELKGDKTVIIQEESNTYVNPAWNKGVELAKNDYVIISNDDVFLVNIDNLFVNIEELDFDIIFIDLKRSRRTKDFVIEKIQEGEELKQGYGSFFIIKKSKYIPIPDNIKIWYGDNIQFDFNDNKYVFYIPGVGFYMSLTLKSNDSFLKIAKDDEINYKNFLKSKLEDQL